MGFCSESLLLFAAFHPGTSANDCLGTFQWFGWRPWDQHQDGILWIFFGGSTTGVGLGVDEKKPEIIHTRRFIATTFMAWSQAQTWSYSEQISKIVWFQSCFGLIFHPWKMMRKNPRLVAWWMVGFHVCWDEVSAIFRQEIQTTVRQLQDWERWSAWWRNWG